MHDDQPVHQRKDSGGNGFSVGVCRDVAGVAPAHGQLDEMVQRMAVLDAGMTVQLRIAQRFGSGLMAGESVTDDATHHIKSHPT